MPGIIIVILKQNEALSKDLDFGFIFICELHYEEFFFNQHKYRVNSKLMLIKKIFFIMQLTYENKTEIQVF